MLLKHDPKTVMKRAERYDFPSTIEYRLNPPDSLVRKAVTINISTTGLAAYLFSAHPEGQEITIITPLPVGRSGATVRWIRKQEEGFFLTGLKFTNDRPPA